jgi:RecG-like helicase
MSGLFLIVFIVLFCLSFIWAVKDDGYMDTPPALVTIFAFIIVVMVIAIPISRNDCKSNIVKAEQLQSLLDLTRANNDITQFEKISVMNEVISYNETIAEWHVKSEHWYQNKWWYVPEVKNVQFIK